MMKGDPSWWARSKDGMSTMVRTLPKHLRTALVMMLIMTIICGLVYPLTVTGIAQLIFPEEANGSQIDVNGTVVGSNLIGQWFTDPAYFWGRLSASDFNASDSGGTNLGPQSGELRAMVQSRIDALHAADPNNTDPIPSDLVTASASGLDPHISYAGAVYQLPRVAKERGMNESFVLALVNSNSLQGAGGVRLVKVLELNLDLDEADKIGLGQGSGEENGIGASSEPKSTVAFGLTAEDALYMVALVVLVIPLAWGSARLLFIIYDERPGRLTSLIKRIESPLYRLAGVKGKGMDWKEYLTCVLMFNLIGMAVLMALLMTQGFLPLNPENLDSLPSDLAFNTAVSFTTNTNWQSYAGERTMSYLSQMLGLTVQNFLSAATGLAVLMALIRGIRNRSSEDLGNFWTDMTRAVMLLIPLALVLSLFMVSQGTVQTLDGPIVAHLIDPYNSTTGQYITTQTIAVGPVASQEAIKLLGTNGGGFFNANSAHPFENPNLLSNLVSTAAVLIIPIGLCLAFGHLIKDRRQSLALLLTMSILFAAFAILMVGAEMDGNPVITQISGVSQMSTVHQAGGNLEGKELRFGIVPSCLFTAATTGTSCGAVDSMLESYTPLGGMCPLVLIQFGEVVFGGVGSGMYGMLVFVIVAVFIASLMIGRMPEYLGKKIGPSEMKLCTAILIIPVATVLAGTALAVMLPDVRAAILNQGPHGFTEVLYAFSSAANNNGSAFAGLTANIEFLNYSLAGAMLIGRYAIIVLTLCLAGSMGAKNRTPVGPGTLPTHTITFTFWLLGVIVLLGALSYFLALSLGPIVEVLR